MKKYSFTVDMVADDLDVEDVKTGLSLFCKDNHQEAVSIVKPAGIKQYSEHGYKVWRAKMTGVTVKQAGDAHNPKIVEDGKSATIITEAGKADGLLPSV